MKEVYHLAANARNARNAAIDAAIDREIPADWRGSRRARRAVHAALQLRWSWIWAEEDAEGTLRELGRYPVRKEDLADLARSLSNTIANMVFDWDEGEDAHVLVDEDLERFLKDPYVAGPGYVLEA